VKDFNNIAAPFTEIVKKYVGFKWNDELMRISPTPSIIMPTTH
jgi:hypothetical protein